VSFAGRTLAVNRQFGVISWCVAVQKEFSSVVLNPAANERAAIMMFYGRKDFEQKHAVSCGRVTLP
jgi:hypothetical protein